MYYCFSSVWRKGKNLISFYYSFTSYKSMLIGYKYIKIVTTMTVEEIIYS